MNNTNVALQVTDFDFYGDSLIALKDNSTGEIYAAINHILRSIGFSERQVKHIHKKWNEDIIVAKGVQNFVLPSKNGNQDTTCISNRKLPIALTKVTITPKMKHDQPEIAKRLELYQDKCADVLASIFIDHQQDIMHLQPLFDALTTLTQSMTVIQQDINTLKEQQQTIQKQLPKKRYSTWKSKMFPKYQLLMDYFGIEHKELYHNLYKELKNTYPDIDLNQEQDDYCFKNGLDGCFTQDVIEHNKQLRMLFTAMVDSLLEKYKISSQTSDTLRQKTIFDD